MMNCDPETGTCLLPDTHATANAVPAAPREGWAVHYIGDPMCSWCWGISPAVRAVADFCAAEGVTFTMTMGGLRAGGGDAWYQQFKDFLRNEWEHISKVTGQPFSFSLLEQEHFNYDTEPACRAVVAIQMLGSHLDFPSLTTLNFFSAIQHKFYVDGCDPKTASFYRDLCTTNGIDFDDFSNMFESDEAKAAVRQEFERCRQWGVRSFPTMLLEHNQEMRPLAVGFVAAEQVLERISHALSA